MIYPTALENGPIKRSLRAEVNALRELCAVIERNPWMPRPSFQTSTEPTSRSKVKFNLWSPLGGAEGDTPAQRMKDSIRAIRRAFPDVKIWDKNVPGDYFTDRYHEVSAEWMGVEIVITTAREDICEVSFREEEYTEEVPDPEQVAEIPMVTVTKTRRVREVVCN